MKISSSTIATLAIAATAIGGSAFAVTLNTPASTPNQSTNLMVDSLAPVGEIIIDTATPVAPTDGSTPVTSPTPQTPTSTPTSVPVVPIVPDIPAFNAGDDGDDEDYGDDGDYGYGDDDDYGYGSDDGDYEDEEDD